MISYLEFISEGDVVSIGKKLGSYEARKLAGQRARESGNDHYAIEHPDGWKVSHEHPGTRWSTNRIIKVNKRGKEEHA